jgi:hypothetical protein
MSKEKARGEQSYKNEELLLALLPEVLRAKGFDNVATRRQGGMKFLDATSINGDDVRFCVKQGWTDARTYAAIQFGMFDDPEPESIPAARFVHYVTDRVASAKAKGATHGLLVHMIDARITNHIALNIDDVASAYNHQIAQWPRRARNTKTQTLYFEDSRQLAEAACVAAVTNLEVSLESISGEAAAEPSATMPGSKKITAEIERRMRQQVFRLAVGARCKWQCVVSGTEVREVLDAAHLPGKDWRFDNEAEDGLLVRADLHRLLDRGLAEIKGGKFVVAAAARTGEYAQFHNRPIPPLP